MPVIKSAIERMKTNEDARKRNAHEKTEMRTAVKKFEKASADGAKDVKDIYQDAISAIDHACSKGLIKKNAANRKKSHLAKINNTLDK